MTIMIIRFMIYQYTKMLTIMIIIYLYIYTHIAIDLGSLLFFSVAAVPTVNSAGGSEQALRPLQHSINNKSVANRLTATPSPLPLHDLRTGIKH